MKRFLRRLRLDQALKEAEEADDETQLLAQRGKDSRTREAALEATRVKMCELAVKTEDRETLAVMLKTLSEEKAREHELVMRERQLAVAEEHAKVAWRKLEVEVARAQLKLLPKALEILGDESLADAVKIAAVRRCLMEAGAAAGLTAGGTAADGEGGRTALAVETRETAANDSAGPGVEQEG